MVESGSQAKKILNEKVTIFTEKKNVFTCYDRIILLFLFYKLIITNIILLSILYY